ncbi:hypothetical protein H6503_06975 [Candidatus Woesearchaeota archaeon]|nr:hypothetical protein [Candidatus Woesearchaeota archaeon]
MAIEQDVLDIYKKHSTIELPDGVVVDHLNGIINLLRPLSEVFMRQEHDSASRFVDAISSTLDLMAQRYSLDGERINFGLTIDPTDNGFPSIGDLMVVAREKEKVDEIIASLPTEEQLVDSVRDHIYRGNNPVNSQNLLRRHRYFSSLKETEILQPMHISDPIIAYVGKKIVRYD